MKISQVHDEGSKLTHIFKSEHNIRYPSSTSSFILLYISNNFKSYLTEKTMGSLMYVNSILREDKLFYSFKEKSIFSGVNIGSEDVSLEAGPVEHPFYMYLRVSLPISVSLLALVLTLTTVAICLKRSKLFIMCDSRQTDALNCFHFHYFYELLQLE
jgi:hypothetical protein